jgi:hypothetical protein
MTWLLLDGSTNADSAGAEDKKRRHSLVLRPAALVLAAACSIAALACAAQNPSTTAPLPDSPQPQATPQPATPHPTTPQGPCPVRGSSASPVGEAAQAGQAAQPKGQANGNQAVPAEAGATGQPQTEGTSELTLLKVPCPPPFVPLINWYARFLDGPKVKAMTPKEKAWLAVRNVADPFNGLTILASSAIAVGANSHSPYGPGMTGWGRYVGVDYTQDMTGEFIGTFLIPSLVHQDPHYHRMPTATIKRRIAHCFYQIVWTQGDDGNGMINYADVAGFGIDDEIGNLYVPGRETNARATAERYGTTLALAPVENFVTEFLPDVARKIHVHVVLIQQIINQVANKEATNGTP